MADDNMFRSTRLGEPYRRADRSTRPSDSAGETDPLAELARLIGKNDPYAAFGLRDSARGEQDEADPRADFSERRYALPQERAEEPHYDESFMTATEDYGTSQHSPAVLGPRGEEWAVQDRAAYREPQFEAEEEQEHPEPQHNAEQDHHRGEQGFHDDSSGFDQYEDQVYDDPPRVRRHGGLATALALIGCAVLGTAGAYAYRSYYSQPAGAQSPPVITADSSTPTKIIPAPSGEGQSGKIVQERLANASKEQVVSKQEEPVALKDLGTQAAPRIVLPAPVAPSSGNAASAPPAPGSTAPGSNEPKRVRTLAIRPDGMDVSPKPGVAPAPSGAAGSRSAGGPDARGSGPLSLDPQAAPTGPTPRTRTATAPTPVQSEASATAGSGGFLVQLSSQKTEAEAATSFHSLQAKFPNELGGRQPIVKRADLGSKGVFYRTMVGPFASAQDANQFCVSYKAAGGQCVVPTP
jgi:hypothetical protein